MRTLKGLKTEIVEQAVRADLRTGMSGQMSLAETGAL